METKRQRQTAEIIRRHFSELLLQEASYLSNGALVTVTSVKMSSDLGLAKIYLSIYGTEAKHEVLMAFQQETMRLRQGLAQRVRRKMRRVPDIDFYLDDTLDEMYRLNSIFDKLHEDKQMGSEEE